MFLGLDEASDYKNKDYPQNGKPDHLEGALLAVRFGQDIAGSDVEQKAGEETEIQDKKIFGKFKEKS